MFKHYQNKFLYEFFILYPESQKLIFLQFISHSTSISLADKVIAVSILIQGCVGTESIIKVCYEMNDFHMGC